MTVEPEVESVSVRYRMSPRALAPIARGVALPENMAATFTMTSGLEVELDVVTRDRRPRIEAVTLSGGPISSGDLRLPLADWLDHVVSTQAVTVKAGARKGDVVIAPPRLDDQAPRRTARDASRGRAVTTDDLAAFVEAYNEGGIEGAADELFISEATAYRRLKACRKQGLLPQKGDD